MLENARSDSKVCRLVFAVVHVFGLFNQSLTASYDTGRRENEVSSIHCVFLSLFPKGVSLVRLFCCQSRRVLELSAAVLASFSFLSVCLL